MLIYLEQIKSPKLDDEEESIATVFSMAHPLDEVCPVAIRHESVRLIDDVSLSIVFTSEKPSICMLYDKQTGQHSVYCIRKIRSDEWLEMSDKLTNSVSSMHNLSHRVSINFIL